MYIYPDLGLREFILALEADVILFPVGMLLKLYTNDLTPTRATVAADLTELTNVQVPGYADASPAWAGLQAPADSTRLSLSLPMAMD
jgi:hypothetical protein